VLPVQEITLNPALNMEQKITNLNTLLQKYQSAVIAFSGGVDSTFLARTAKDIYGENLLLITATSSTYPYYELDEAKSLAELRGIKHMIIVSEEIEIPGYADTPLYRYRSQLLPLADRFDLSLKMIAILRTIMKDVNIAATTALRTIDKLGREKAIMAGANVIMPNITPGMFRNDYSLYDNKPCTDENPEDCRTCLEARTALTGNDIGFGEWGDSAHFKKQDG